MGIVKRRRDPCKCFVFLRVCAIKKEREKKKSSAKENDRLDNNNPEFRITRH